MKLHAQCLCLIGCTARVWWINQIKWLLYNIMNTNLKAIWTFFAGETLLLMFFELGLSPVNVVTLIIYHMCHPEVNLSPWLRASDKCLWYKYHNIQIKPCLQWHHAKGECGGALRQQLAHICLWSTYKWFDNMSVNQLWLQLVGQILRSSFHPVNTAGISLRDSMWVCVCSVCVCLLLSPYTVQ